MNNLLITLVVSIGLLLLVLLVLCAKLIIFRYFEIRKRNAIQSYIERRQAEWFQYLVEGSVPMEQLRPANQLEVEAVDQLFFQYQSTFSSEQIAFGMKQFAMTYMESYYKNHLFSTKWSIRMNGLQKIYLFNWLFLSGEIIKLLRSKKLYSKEEYILIYRILAKFEPKHFVSYYMNPKVPLGEFDYRKLLIELEERQLSLLAEKFVELPHVLQKVLIEMIGVKFYLEWLPLLHKCLDSPDKELRISALKSIAALGSLDDMDRYERFAKSAHWQERLMTAKIFRSAHPQQAERVLGVLIADSNYQVRLQAAASMKVLKSGTVALMSVITTSNDKYAIEIAQEMLGKE